MFKYVLSSYSTLGGTLIKSTWHREREESTVGVVVVFGLYKSECPRQSAFENESDSVFLLARISLRELNNDTPCSDCRVYLDY